MVKIAVPNKGRLNGPVVELLNKAGIRVDSSRKLVSRYKDIEVLFVRTQDIPELVRDGAAELGITGLDLVEETGADVKVSLKLGFGRTRLVLAAPKNLGLRSPKDVKVGVKVATEFPKLTAKYFKQLGKKVEIVTVSGATEVTPYLGVADLIVDLVSTGTTLELNNLKIIDTIMDSEAVLISNKSYRNDNMAVSLSSVINAQSKRYIMVNVPRKNLAKVEKIIPGMQSPTVMDLADGNFVAVHSVVDEDKVFATIKKLKMIGCKDILVLPIERLVS